MKKLTISLAVLGAMLLGGCASQKPGYDYTAFRQARPRSILVVMPTNDSPDIKGATSVLARATVPLAEKGYYVFPVAVVDEMFRQNGLTGGHDIQSAPSGRCGKSSVPMPFCTCTWKSTVPATRS